MTDFATGRVAARPHGLRGAGGEGGRAPVIGGMRPPLFILAPPRSFTSVVCAMLGQHPEMYGLPETNLFTDRTMLERTARERRAANVFLMGHGLLRVVAELYCGRQDEPAVAKAREWLRGMSAGTTADVFRALGNAVSPLILIEKSPSTVNRMAALERLHADFPDARYIHLLRHPRGHGESMIRLIDELGRKGPVASTHWALRLSSVPRGGAPAQQGRRTILDPQTGWYARHRLISRFLRSLPPSASMRIRGEDLLSDPEGVLPEICRWIGVRTDAAAIDEMTHPERSPFAFLGPPGARFGNDLFFLRDPVLRPARGRAHSLDGPLGWRDDGEGFLPEVRELAEEFGYT